MRTEESTRNSGLKSAENLMVRNDMIAIRETELWEHLKLNKTISLIDDVEMDCNLSFCIFVKIGSRNLIKKSFEQCLFWMSLSNSYHVFTFLKFYDLQLFSIHPMLPTGQIKRLINSFPENLLCSLVLSKKPLTKKLQREVARILENQFKLKSIPFFRLLLSSIAKYLIQAALSVRNEQIYIYLSIVMTLLILFRCSLHTVRVNCLADCPMALLIFSLLPLKKDSHSIQFLDFLIYSPNFSTLFCGFCREVFLNNNWVVRVIP